MASSGLRTALVFPLMLAFLAGASSDVLARNSGSSIKCATCPRDSPGKIKRDPRTVDEFKRTHPKPPGCYQCEVDHINPFSKGGQGDP